MKITDPDVIKNGEKELIDAVKDDLDLDVVKKILEKKMAQTALRAKGGEIVVHDNRIAFRMDFDLNISGSLMFDRDGNYISETGETFKTEDLDEPDPDMALDQEESPNPDMVLDDDLNIDLPDSGPDTVELALDDIEKIENTDDDLLPDPFSDDETGLEENTLGLDDEAFDDSGLDDLDRLTEDIGLDDDEEEDLAEDDIDDIFKESQDFWDKKD